MIKDYKEEFRDQISTVDKTGRRNWIYPKKPDGVYYKWRSIVSYILLATLFSAPFIKVNGHPLFLLNFFERKFILFGQIFWPQDFYLLLLTFLTLVVFVILFTVIFGRLWCGWACPQTIFMEMVFRKIEYLIEGDANQQRKLAKAPWDGNKIFKKTLKQTLFFSISFLIGNLLMAYLVGTDRLYEIISSPPSENMAGFFTVLIFSGVFYWVFSWFREQACTIVCPYGRLQGVLLDKKSIVVSYDHVRGEKREKFTRDRSDEAGDCIDCRQCVDVCPTGIDIRNGIQLECISCTACIDACNFVMDKVNKPRGLIRHASEENIEKGKKFKVNNRIIGYSAVLGILIFALGFMISRTSNIKTNLTRVHGSTFIYTPGGEIRNLYNMRISNKTYADMPLTLSIGNENAKIIINGDKIVVPAESHTERIIFVDIPKNLVTSPKTELTISLLSSDGQVVETVDANFLGPLK